ncbi:MAG TPA: hypothetical protein VGS41_03675, partial [Chthonomonadales bacterium]|nr:hypothetical protein [Chthonomonadales bacterium]
MLKRRQRAYLTALLFLLPNLLGFLVFTLFPVGFSLWMAFTNWTPKPAVKFAFIGLRNFADLLGMRAQSVPHATLLALAALCAAVTLVSGLAALWARMEEIRGARAGCAL